MSDVKRKHFRLDTEYRELEAECRWAMVIVSERATGERLDRALAWLAANPKENNNANR